MMPSDPGAPTATRRRRDGDGQVLPLFALSVFVIIGMVALVVDVAWFWTNQQQMQKAADAGALAGAVYLPGDVPRAYSSAMAEAKKNGYVNGSSGVTVTAAQDTSNRRRLKVTISGPVQTYFGQVFCVITGCSHQITESVTGIAEFTLPVPMGSPQNYYGVGTYVYNQVNTQTNDNEWQHGLGRRGQLSERHRLDQPRQRVIQRQQLRIHRDQRTDSDVVFVRVAVGRQRRAQ